MKREILTKDAATWLTRHKDVGSIITSLPDHDEIEGLTANWDKESSLSIEAWQGWFTETARLCMEVTSPKCPTIFYQTDRKANGRLYSKAALLYRAAENEGVRTLWHKIALRRDVGARDLYRPTYTHLIAFSREGKPGKPTPDVFNRGRTLYPNGMGIGAAAIAVKFAALSTDTIVDPFCGRGTVPAVANAYGLKAIGVDIDPQQTEKAKALNLRRSA